MRILFALFMVMLAACSPSQNTSTQTGASGSASMEEARVLVQSPADGSVIYAELLYAAGIVQHEAQAGFRLLLVDAAENTLAETIIYPDDNANWRVELPHQYQGEPSEMTLISLPLDAESAEGYSTTPLIVAGLAHRPEGTFGSIRLPHDGLTVGGESLLVEGTISGVGDVPVRIQLIPNNDPRPLDSAVVESSSPYALDETLWRIELSTAFYIGPARLVLVTDDVILAEIGITITEAAG